MSAIEDRISERLTRDRLGLELRRARRPFLIWLGLLAVGLTAAAVLLAKLDVPWPWQHRYEFRVAVADAKGVVPNSDEVRIAGVPVGRIVGVALEHGQPVITASIDPRYAPVYQDARLELRPNTPLDDMYLDVVSRGTKTAGSVPGGGELTADRTQVPVDISAVLDVFNSDVRPRVTATINALGQGLGPHGEQFRQALVELAPFLDAAKRLAGEMATRQTQTARLIHNFSLLTQTLAERQNQVTQLVSAGSTTLQTLASVEQPLGQLLAQLPPTLRELPASFAALRTSEDHLDPALVALQPVAQVLPAAMQALERLAPDAHAGMAALDKPLPALTALMNSTSPLASNLSLAFARLRPQAPRLDRATSQIIPCEAAVEDFFQWTLSVMKYSDLHGVFPRGQDVGGLQSTGATKDPLLIAGKSCAAGGPHR
jgi:phospholipid/cholesterol/gamma-HCH transport system substrate-binding protein